MVFDFLPILCSLVVVSAPPVFLYCYGFFLYTQERKSQAVQSQLPAKSSDSPTRAARVVSARVVATCSHIPFTQYEIVTERGHTSRRCLRRYNDLYVLYKHLCKVLPPGHPALSDFPNKVIFTSLATKTIKDRWRELNAFMDKMAQYDEAWEAMTNFIDLPLSPTSSFSGLAEHVQTITAAEKVVKSLGEEWVIDQEQDGASVWSQKSNGEKVYKVIINIPALVETVWENSGNCEQRLTWDTSMASASVVDSGDKVHDIVQYTTTPLAGGAVSARHFVIRRKIDRKPNHIKCLQAVEPSEKVVATVPGAVRVQSMFASTELHQVGDYTAFTQIVSVHPGGFLPSWLVECTTANEMMKSVLLLREACIKPTPDS